MDRGETPAWWPYAREFPGWQVWRGVDDLCYARRLGSSPPLVVRGEDALDLRDAVRRMELSRSADRHPWETGGSAPPHVTGGDGRQCGQRGGM